jgi:hypothetical protein
MTTQVPWCLSAQAPYSFLIPNPLSVLISSNIQQHAQPECDHNQIPKQAEQHL